MANLPGQQLLNTLTKGQTLLGTNYPNPFASFTDGWWVFVGVVGSIMLAGTPVAPFVLGIMTIACIFQAEKLVTNQ